MTISPQNISLEMPSSKATAARNIKQPYMIMWSKEKTHQTPENRKKKKITKRILRKPKPQSKVRIGNIFNREYVFANHCF